MLYLAIKHLHITCVMLSISGFCLRGFLHLRKSALAGRLDGRWLRIVPHINDAILLTAAIALTILIGQYPFVDAWLTAKVFGLIAYIILGALALGAGRSPRLRIGAGLAAVLVFGWIVTVALAKDPLGFLSWPA
jgi:uncharacterized membrane protein SirB2